MTIQKKSLINSLNTTKKAIVASATPANPSVNASVAARIAPRVNAKVAPRVNAKVAPRVNAKVAPRVNAKVAPRVAVKN